MNNDRREESRRRLLADLLAGTRSDDDPEVASTLAEDESLRTELLELRAIGDGLDRHAQAVRREIDSAVRSVDAQDVATARQALARFHGESAARVRGRPGWLALAAAAVVVGALLFWREGDDVPDISLGGNGLEVGMQPSGSVESIDEFSWNRPGRVRVEIWAAAEDAPIGEAPIATYVGRDTRFVPTPAELDRMRAARQIYWTLAIEAAVIQGSWWTVVSLQ